MPPIQRKIQNALRATRDGLPMKDLIDRVASPGTTEQEVRSAVLPMISSDRIELTPDLKLRLRSR